MTTMRTRLLGLVMATGLVVTAAQAVPPALDRVPADTPVIFGVQSLSGLMADAERWVGALAPPDAAGGLMMLQMMLGTPGLTADGSAAVALSFPDGVESEPTPTIILPVTDFAAFSEALEGKASDGVTALNLMGDTAFAKDLGGGFVALGPVMETIEQFSGSAGQSGAHKARMGARAAEAADRADLFVVVDVAAMRPLFDEGMAQMDEQIEFMGMMAGEEAAGQLEMIAKVARAVVADGQTAVLGLGADESGLWLDFAGQFAAGSDTAKVFAGAGDSTPLLGALPAMDYIFAGAFDSSHPGVRSVMASAMKMNAGSGFSVKSEEIVELTDGSAFVLGVTPGLFAGGLLANSAAFSASSDPAALHGAMKKQLGEMDGQSNQGVLVHTTWQDAAAEVAGQAVDAWGMTMEGDPNHPNGAAMGTQLQQMAMFFGGQAGPAGFVTHSDKGLYVTYSKNSKLMSSLLNGDGGSMRADERIDAVAGHLPEQRTAEGYLNIKGLLDMVVPTLAMFGLPLELDEVPEAMNPVGLGLATGGGGMHARVFVPGDVLGFISVLAQSMESDGDEWDEVEEEPESKPRF